MEIKKKSWHWRALVASCAFLLGLGTLLILPRAFGQVKPVSGNEGQMNLLSHPALIPNASGSQRFEIALRRIQNGRSRSSSNYFLRAPLFVVSPIRNRSASFHWAASVSASRLASYRLIAISPTRQPLIAFSKNTSLSIQDPSTTWNGGSGNWSDSTKWSNGVPNSTTNTFIDGGKAIASSVNLNIAGAQVGNLTIDSGDSLALPNGTSLTVYGATIGNAGTISINSTGFGAYTLWLTSVMDCCFSAAAFA
jgi:hypothetical protein